MENDTTNNVIKSEVPAPTPLPKEPTAGNPDKKVKIANERRGRPPGARNKPKMAPPPIAGGDAVTDDAKPTAAVATVARVRRVKGADTKDTARYIDATVGDLEAAIQKHNTEHPGSPIRFTLERGVKVKPQMDADECRFYASMGLSALASAMNVPAVVDKSKLDMWAASAAEITRYIPTISPLHVAIAGLLASSAMMIVPLLAMKRAGITKDMAIQPPPGYVILGAETAVGVSTPEAPPTENKPVEPEAKP